MELRERVPISNISSVGIIFRKGDPRQLFIEVKDDGHPIKLVQRQLCFIGGNWIGDTAKGDTGPLATFRRELTEELSLERPAASTLELKLLGDSPEGNFYSTPIADRAINPRDQKMLADVKQVICESCIPFGAFLNTISKAAMDAADPLNRREGFTTLSVYWCVPLAKRDWLKLFYLQMHYGNLSNESITLFTSLPEIIEKNVHTAFGHDRVLQAFFSAYGLKEAAYLPLVPGVESLAVGPALATYDDYLQYYDVAKKPI